jgi:hypothetical protein
MWSKPGFADAGMLTVTLEEPDQCGVAQGLTSPRTPTADEEDDWRLRVGRPLVHDVAAERGERRGLVQVNNTLGPRLGSCPLGVVSPIAHDHPPSAVLNILKVKT